MRFLLLFIVILSSQIVDAQKFIRIDSVQQVSVPIPDGVFYPVLSNDGGSVAIRSYSSRGLQLYHMKSQKLDIVAEKSKLIEHLVFNTENLYYSESLPSGSVVVKSFDLSNHNPGSGRKQSTNGFWNWWASLWSRNNAQKAVLPDLILVQNNRLSYPCLSIQDDCIVMHTSENEYKNIKPLNVKYYMHASLSPSQNKIVAYAYGKGTFVCDVDGSNVQMIDGLEAPVWLSNDIVLGMITRDDGHEVNSSGIVAWQLSSKKQQTLLSNGYLALYPRYNPYCHKISCHTANGKLYVLHLANTVD